MTTISVTKPKHEIDYYQNKQRLQYIQHQFQKNEYSDINSLTYLTSELCELMERMLTENKTLWDIVKIHGLDETQASKDEDNFDLDKESVKKIILKEISIGQVFYPSDIANEYNLDLKMVMDVMSELKENKQIIEKLE